MLSKLNALAPVLLRSCLYHTVVILLQRSASNTSAHPSPTSLAAAREIVAVSRMQSRSFGQFQFVLSHAYCIYTATSVYMLELKVRVVFS
jgi:hypothetical protein